MIPNRIVLIVKILADKHQWLIRKRQRQYVPEPPSGVLDLFHRYDLHYYASLSINFLVANYGRQKICLAMPRSLPKIAIFEEAAETLEIPEGVRTIQEYYRQYA